MVANDVENCTLLWSPCTKNTKNNKAFLGRGDSSSSKILRISVISWADLVVKAKKRRQLFGKFKDRMWNGVGLRKFILVSYPKWRPSEHVWAYICVKVGKSPLWDEEPRLGCYRNDSLAGTGIDIDDGLKVEIVVDIILNQIFLVL